MAKHVIFLVHGMGDTVPGWSAPVQKLIREKYNLYPLLKRLKFDNHFTFREINYNHVFEGHIEKWNENATAVTTLLEASGIDSKLLNMLMGFSTRAARKEFASTHILDVILYRFMSGLRSQVIAHISEQLVGRLNESRTVPPYSIICHSLGTAVMHDVMQANLTTDHFPLSTAHGVPAVYMTLANVSRVLEGKDSNVYTSAVRPRLADNKRLYGCDRFINVAHTLDPFTRVRPFKPGWRKNAASALNKLKYDSYRRVSISGLTGNNPHDFEHYLRHPQTHVALFRALISKGVVSKAQLESQMAQYKKDTLGGRFDAVKSAVQSLQLDEQSTLTEAIRAWTEFQLMIKGLAP